MATLKAWYPLTKDYKDYSGNSSELTQGPGTGTIESQPGLLGRAVAQPVVGKSSHLLNERCGLKGSHAMFCFMKVIALHNTSTANGILGCHSHSDMSGTGITLRPINGTQYNLSVNTGSGSERTYHSYYTNRVLNVGDWHHVGFTWDEENNLLSFYIDGVLDKVITTVPDMLMIPDHSFHLFIWSLTYLGTSQYRPAMALQDVRVYSGVPTKSEITRISKGLFFHLPLDSPCEGSKESPTVWTPYSAYNTVLESRHDYVKSVMVRDGTIAIRSDATLISGNRYRISGYCFKNGVPVTVTTVTTYARDHRTFNEPETGWFSMVFEATGSWPIHANGPLGYPKAGDVYEFTDLSLEHLSVQTSRADTLTDASGMGHDCEADKESPTFVPNMSAIGRGSCYFENQHLRATENITREGNTITALIWIKGTGPSVGSYHMPLNMGGIKLEISVNDTNLRTGTYVDGVRKVFNSTVTLLDGNWHLVGLTYDGVSIKSYCDGVRIGELSVPGTLTSFNDFPLLGKLTWPTSAYASNNLHQSDARIYGTALTDDDIKALYEDRFSFNKDSEFLAKGYSETKPNAGLTRPGVLSASNLLEGNFKPSLIDYSTWVLGATSATGFSRNGSSSETIIVAGEGPHGIEDVLWEASNNDTASGADGGWNGGHVPIDNSKTYRLSVWIKRKVQGNGSLYFGTRGLKPSGRTALENFSSVSQSNPYFYAGSPVGNGWRLFIGYIFPVGASEQDLGQGMYTEQGVKVGSMRSFRFVPETTATLLRTYLYYSTNTSTVQQWYRPRIDLVDGNEPSFEELLYCAEHTPLLPLYENNVYQGDGHRFGDTMVTTNYNELK